MKILKLQRVFLIWGGGNKYVCVCDDNEKKLSTGWGISSSHSDELEPIGAAVLLEKEFLAVGEAARFAALAFGRVGAVEIGDVLVADVAEPGAC